MPEQNIKIDYAEIRKQLKNNQQNECLMTLYNYQIALKDAFKRPQSQEQVYLIANHLINIRYLIDKIDINLFTVFTINQLRWWEETYKDEQLQYGINVDAKKVLMQHLKMVIEYFLYHHSKPIETVAQTFLTEVQKMDLDLYDFKKNQTKINPLIKRTVQQITNELDVDFIQCNTKPITNVSIKPDLKIRINHQN